MTSPDIITDATNRALVEVIARYASTVSVAHSVEGVHGFADEYLGEDAEMTTTWAEVLERKFPQQKTLQVILRGQHPDSGERVFIDPEPVDGGLAAIVKPGFYYKDGRPVTDINDIASVRKTSYGRPVLRELTEAEGTGLISDLNELLEKTPHHMTVAGDPLRQLS